MNRIQQLREERHMTQVRLSIELEVSQETVSAYEMGKHYPSVKSLLKLREIFGVNIDYILGLSENRYDTIPADSLSQEEMTILQLFRNMKGSGQECLIAYAEGYLANQTDVD